MNFINNFIPEELINAIGWTIFHSIWQGIIIAIILGTILLLTGKKSARLRYNISVAALIIMFILSAITFFNTYDRSNSSSPENLVIINSGNEDVTTQSSVYTSVFEKTNFDLPDFIKAFFNEHITFIVSAWVIGFLFFSFRFAGGLLFVQRLKSSGLKNIDSFWLNKLHQFEDKIKIKQAVQIFESARVRVPIAIGYIKPIILLPFGLLTGLPSDQVEAILIHELAHIKRYDFLVNLFQSFVETVLFYHPVIWWISSTINSERENCCDDIAVKICGDPLSYSKALYNIQQINEKESALVMALVGKNNQLYRRIKRMNTKTNKTAYGIKFIAFSLLLIAMAIVSLYSNTPASESKTNLASIGFVNPLADGNDKISFKTPSSESLIAHDTTSLKKGKHTIKFYDEENGKDIKYKARLNNGKLEELYIDGEKVDDKDLPKYENKVAQKTEEYEALINDYRGNMKDLREKMKSFREKMKDLGFRHNHNFNFDFDFDFPPFPNEVFNSGLFDSTLQKEIMENVQKELKENLADISVNIPPIHIPPIHIPKVCIPPIDLDELRESLKNCKFDTAAFKESMKEFKENMKNFKFDMKQFSEEMKKNGPGSEAFKKSMEELRKNMHNLKDELRPLKGYIRETRDELVKDNLIEPGEDIDNFKLTKDEMIVDGKKVSPELHKKYLEIYKKHYGKELTGDHKVEFDN